MPDTDPSIDPKPTHRIGPVDVEWRDGSFVGVGWVRIDVALPQDFPRGDAYWRLDRELNRCMPRAREAIEKAYREYVEEVAQPKTATTPTLTEVV